MATGMPDGFWKTALRYGGIATVVLFVLWSLYGTILNKIALTILGEQNTMIFMVLITVLIFLVTVFGLWLWFLNNRNTNSFTTTGATSINFEVPLNWTFRKVATALAQSEDAAVHFEGFEESELNTELVTQNLSTQSTKTALELLNKLSLKPIRPYYVVRQDGFYQLTAK
jgi:hypothetical protein